MPNAGIETKVLESMKFTKNDEAVSPVIGVILMVAITVILAAVIAAFVFGMAGNVNKTKIVSVTANRVDATHVDFTNMGGQDVNSLSAIAITGGVAAGTLGTMLVTRPLTTLSLIHIYCHRNIQRWLRTGAVRPEHLNILFLLELFFTKYPIQKSRYNVKNLVEG